MNKYLEKIAGIPVNQVSSSNITKGILGKLNKITKMNDSDKALYMFKKLNKLPPGVSDSRRLSVEAGLQKGLSAKLRQKLVSKTGIII